MTKIASFSGDKAEFNEENQWDTENPLLQETLDQYTSWIEENLSPANGFDRPAIFYGVVAELGGEVVDDDEEERNDGPETDYVF